MTSFRVPEETTRALHELARPHHTTVGTLLQGAWARLLVWLTGHRDVAFGTVVSVRPAEVSGAQSMVGLSINTVPVRANITPATTTMDLLDELRSAHNNTLEHEHSELSDIHRITGQEQLFDTVFVYENYPTDTAASSGAHQLTIIEARDFYHYPLTVQAGPGRELELRVQFRTDVFDVAGIEALVEWLQRVSVAMISEPTRPVLSTDLGNRAMITQSATTAVPASEYRDTGGGYSALATLAEQILADIYARVLAVEHIGVNDSFFDLGGDSLSAIRVIAAINTALDSQLAVRTLFDAPSVRSLSQQLARHAGSVN